MLTHPERRVIREGIEQIGKEINVLVLTHPERRVIRSELSATPDPRRFSAHSPRKEGDTASTTRTIARSSCFSAHSPRKEGDTVDM